MLQPEPFGAALATMTLLGTWCACFTGWFFAFELLSRRSGTAILVVAGLAAGVGVWALPCLVETWPPTLGFAPGVTIASLLVMIGAAAAGLAVERHNPEPRGVIGGGAILGAGIAVSHGALLLALRGPVAIDFDNVPIAKAVAVASALAVAALALRRRWPGRIGQVAAVVCLTAATAASQALVRGGATLQSGEASEAPIAHLIAAPSMAPIALALLIAAFLAVAAFAVWPSFSLATRLRAWRESRRPSPAPTPAGTMSPRPSPGR